MHPAWWVHQAPFVIRELLRGSMAEWEENWLWHLLVLPWTSCFASLSLSFPICEVGLVISVDLLGLPCGLNKMVGRRVEILSLYSIMNTYQLISQGPPELLRGAGLRAV